MHYPQEDVTDRNQPCWLKIQNPKRFNEALEFTQGKIKKNTLWESVTWLMRNAKELTIHDDFAPHSFAFTLKYQGDKPEQRLTHGGIILHNANLGETFSVSISDQQGMYYGVHT